MKRGELDPPPDRLCGARIPKRNKTCDMAAGQGTDHVGWGKCRYHGGTSAALSRKAELDMHAARQEMGAKILGLKVETTPEAALRDELYRTAGIVHWLEQQIDLTKLDDDGKVTVTMHNPMGEAYQARFTPAEALANPATPLGRVYLMLMGERTHLARISNFGIQAGLTERAIQVEEEKVRQMGELLNLAIAESGLAPAQQSVLRASFRKVIENQIAS